MYEKLSNISLNAVICVWYKLVLNKGSILTNVFIMAAKPSDSISLDISDPEKQSTFPK